MKLRIMTPKKLLLDVEVQEVYLPGPLGELGVWEGHAPLVSTVQSGVVWYLGVNSGSVVVQSGFLEVLDERVTVLVGTAELDLSIDVERSRRELDELCARDGDLDCPWEEQDRRDRRKRLLEHRIEVGSSLSGRNPK